jgi:hypothetical protein
VKTYSQFIQEAKGDGASPYEVYKPPADQGPYVPAPADMRKYLPPVKKAQIVPQKPPIAPGVPLNLDSPGQKFRRLQLQRKEPPTA